LVKKIIIVKNAIAYTWDWYCHLVIDRASLNSWKDIDIIDWGTLAKWYMVKKQWPVL
jgi:hypothetical protein